MHVRILAVYFLFLMAFGGLAPPLLHAAPSMFGRLFPTLPPYAAPTDAALDALTCGAGTGGVLCALAVPPALSGPLFDPNADADDNPDKVASFFTYFGQFLDHDMTLDLLPLPSTSVDPTTIQNFRDPRLALDSLYGGPSAKRELFSDGKRFLVNDRDLPRTATGTAIIGDGRNDENQVISQIHVAFLRAHNALIDQGMGLGAARQELQWRYQWIVVHEFLPEVLDPDVYLDVFRPDGTIVTRYYDPKHARDAVMPVEFAVAAYRFGHSQVRRAYVITAADAAATPQRKLQVFNNTPGDLHGGRPLTPDKVIFWPNFLHVDGIPPTGKDAAGNPTGFPANMSRKIDTLLSSGLFLLPIPGAAPAGSAILARRNIQRARAYGLPSGQAVAAHLGARVLSNADLAAALVRLGFLADPVIAAPYLGELPLWLYILAESELGQGRKLGPVGSRIVAEVIGGLLAADNKSYINRKWTPPGGEFTAQDLLRDAGVIP